MILTVNVYDAVLSHMQMMDYYYRQHCTQRITVVFRLLRGDFEVFLPTGVTRCTDWGEIWRGRVDSSMPNFTPHSAWVGYEATKLIILPNFWHINAPHDRIPLAIFSQIFTLCGQLHVHSCVKIRVDSLKGFQSYQGLSLRVFMLPKTFRAP